MVGGKRDGKVCESLLKLLNKDGYDATGDKIEIYVRKMDSVGTDETIVAPNVKPCVVCSFVIPLYSKSSNFHVYYNQEFIMFREESV